MTGTSATDRALSEVIGAITSFESTRHPGNSLRILVLADPNAETCTRLRALGHFVSCCPDRQRPGSDEIEATHQRLIASDAEQLISADRGSEVWDIVIAYIGWDRYTETHSPTEVHELIEWIRLHSHLALFAADRMPIDRTNNQLGPWHLQAPIRDFKFLSEWPSSPQQPFNDLMLSPSTQTWPFVLASDHVLASEIGWLPAEELSLLVPMSGENHRFAHTYLHNSEIIVKLEESSPDFFERCQVKNEADFLDGLDPTVRQALGIPDLIAAHSGRVVSQLIRRTVEGVSTPPTRDQRADLEAVLDLAQSWAREGLFHNDFRPWNLIWTSTGVRLIDFADSSTHDTDVSGLPQVLALAGTMLAIAGRDVPKDAGFADAVQGLILEAGIDGFSPDMMFGQPWLKLANTRPDLAVFSSELDDARLLSAIVTSLIQQTQPKELQ